MIVIKRILLLINKFK